MVEELVHREVETYHIGRHARSKKCKLLDYLGEIRNEFYGVYLEEQDREHLEWF